MSRFVRTRRVFFIEEPVFEDAEPHLRSFVCEKTNVHVCTPVLPRCLDAQRIAMLQKTFLDDMLKQNNIADYIAWYYTPMAREFASGLKPKVTVYDCMDELSAFAGAPSAMRENERALFSIADLVFTGGASLYASKRNQHPSVHLFPSSVDVPHFARARSNKFDPADQRTFPRPRLGYAGVIDERMDLELIRAVARERPTWQLIFLGPVVKIDVNLLPKGENIHYLGIKPYAELPTYLSGWDIGMLPFALNESTRFISPTKTPEYLAAGLPVISTPIRDVVTPYGELGLVAIASNADEYIRAAESLIQSPDRAAVRARVDQFLSRSSWDKTWSEMNDLINHRLALKNLSVRNQSRVRAGVAAKGAAHV